MLTRERKKMGGGGGGGTEVMATDSYIDYVCVVGDGIYNSEEGGRLRAMKERAGGGG